MDCWSQCLFWITVGGGWFKFEFLWFANYDNSKVNPNFFRALFCKFRKKKSQQIPFNSCTKGIHPSPTQKLISHTFLQDITESKKKLNCIVILINPCGYNLKVGRQDKRAHARFLHPSNTIFFFIHLLEDDLSIH